MARSCVQDRVIQDGAMLPGFEEYGSTLLGPRPDAVPLPGLLRHDGIAALLPASSIRERRARLSLWSQYYLLALIPPAVAVALTGVRHPDMDLARTAVVLSADSRPVSVCMPEREGTATCPAERLTPLLRRHLQPLAAMLAAAGLHPAVTWSNAGHVLSWVLTSVMVPDERLHRLSSLLERPAWIDGEANPLHAGLVRGARTVCCLRHCLPGMARCGTCPLDRNCVPRGAPAVAVPLLQ